MTKLLTILLVFSHFIPGLPKIQDVQTKSKSELVSMYSSACLDFYNRFQTRDEFRNVDLRALVNSVLDSSISGPGAASSAKMDLADGKLLNPEVIQFYKNMCKPDPNLTALDSFEADLQSALGEYQNILHSLPPLTDLHRLTYSESIDLISADGKVIADIYDKDERRKFIGIDKLPKYVPSTFVAVEDNRFNDHKAIDEVGILRALMKNMGPGGNREGASTISQQVARNRYLKNFDVTIRRKLQEILIAEKLENQLSKNQILEIYLNQIYFGRNSWGIEKAAQSYFEKSAADLTPVETAFLVGIVQGPNFYRNRPKSIEQRVLFVLDKMIKNSLIPSNSDPKQLFSQLKVIPETDIYNSGYLRDYAIYELNKRNQNLLATNNQIKLSINSKMQISTNVALREGLINYERSAVGGRLWRDSRDLPQNRGPLCNIHKEIENNVQKIAAHDDLTKLEAQRSKNSLSSTPDDLQIDDPDFVPANKPENVKTRETLITEKIWFGPLRDKAVLFPPPISDWQLAVLLGNDGKIGLVNGAESYLSRASLAWISPVKYGDVFFVRQESKNGWAAVKPPRVNGAALIMDKTGQVLAMVGGFSYSLSQLNRAFTKRQPGSLMKPFTYLAALQKQIQPNVKLSDKVIMFPSIYRGGKPWVPSNIGGEMSPADKPMRWALEQSHNRMTAELLNLIGPTSVEGLDAVREMTKNFGLYQEDPLRFYPFIIGAQPASLMSLVKVYGEFANGGLLISPQIIDQVTEPDGRVTILKKGTQGNIPGVDEISMYQLRSLLQGVVARGTAAQLSRHSNFLAGKTGTTNDSKEAWFIGFTSDIIIGVYVGFDRPETLGRNATGASVALPIFEKILDITLKNHYLPKPFSPPPKGVVIVPTNPNTGELSKTMSLGLIKEAYRENAIAKELK